VAPVEQEQLYIVGPKTMLPNRGGSFSSVIRVILRILQALAFLFVTNGMLEEYIADFLHPPTLHIRHLNYEVPQSKPSLLDPTAFRTEK